jgi:predicted Zn-dependent peptidase
MIKTRKLDCGITVVMEYVPHFDSAAVGIWVRAGAANETKENSGISHFIEHMMFKGTEKRSALRIAEDVDNLGAQINAFTGKEATCYYIKTLASNMEKSLDILLDMFTGSVFAPEEINRERGVIKEELKMIKDTPDEDALDTICETVLRGNPVGNSIIGTVGSLNKINHSKILNYIDNEYTCDSIVVSIAGKFDEEQVCSMLEERMSGFRQHKEGPDYREGDTEPAFRVKVKDIEQSHLCLATRSVPLSDERYYAFSLLSNVMGGSMSSRFFQDIRERKGLAYSVYSSNSSFSHCGYYNIYAGVAHSNVHKVVDAIREELASLKRDGITGAELSKAKEQLKSSYIFGEENVNGRMFGQGRSMILLGEVKTPQQVTEAIDAVTMEDIEEVEAMICDIEKYSGVLISDKRRPLKDYVR